jgi:hypothetical protein
MPLGLNFSVHATIGDVLFAGDSGLYRSDDSGVSWSRVALLDRRVKALAASPEGYLFAGTDSGLFVSLDTGMTWRWKSEGMGARKDHFPDVRILAVMDSFLYAYVDAGDWGMPYYWARYSYTTGRPIRELIDTAQSKVVTAPPQIADQIFVYPNPTSKSITIESMESPILRVDVLNLLGQEVQHLAGTAAGMPLTTVDLSALAAGTYFLRIETDKGVAMKKIVRE